MKLDQLIARFAQLPGAQVGRGPSHPEAPERDLLPEVEAFLQEHPALRADLGYVEFLHRYSGAGIDNEEQYQIVDIFGFTEASSNMYDLDGPVVDSQGFMVFARVVRHVIEDGKLRDTQEHDYAFDLTSARPPGVYRSYSASSQPDILLQNPESAGFRPTGEDFVEWLEGLVETGGLVAAPGGSVW